MSTKPRTPEHFPRMKHRAAKRRAFYRLIVMPDLSGLIEAIRRASRELAKMTRPSTQAAPTRAASFIPGEKS